RVFFQTGNHGRNVARHKARATQQKWDSIETMVYYAVKMACSNLANVTFELPYTPYYIYDSFGQKALATHGDTVINVGYPGKAIDVGSIEKQVNRINAALPQKCDLFIVGHVHISMNLQLSNGA